MEKEFNLLRDDMIKFPPPKLQKETNIIYRGEKKRHTSPGIEEYIRRINTNEKIMKKYDKNFEWSEEKTNDLLKIVVGEDRVNQYRESKKRFYEFQNTKVELPKKKARREPLLIEKEEEDPVFEIMSDSLDEKELSRPPVRETELENGIAFMNVDMNYSFETKHPKFGGNVNSNWVPVIRIFGDTRNGNSVCAFVHGFLPYLYCDYIPGTDLNKFQEDLEILLAEKCNYRKIYIESLNKFDYVKNGRQKREDFVHETTLISSRSIYGYQSEFKKFIKITLVRPQHVPCVRDYLMAKSLNIYECNIEFVIRFMIDMDIGGFTWIEMKKDFEVRTPQKQESSCQIEIDVNYHSLIAHSTSEEEWSDIAPIRILSFDIECKARRGHFPDAEISTDYVIEIANIVTEYGKKEPIIKNVFNYGSSNPISAAKIYNFPNEVELMKAWKKFLVMVDPDIITVSH